MCLYTLSSQHYPQIEKLNVMMSWEMWGKLCKDEEIYAKRSKLNETKMKKKHEQKIHKFIGYLAYWEDLGNRNFLKVLYIFLYSSYIFLSKNEFLLIGDNVPDILLIKSDKGQGKPC